MKNTIKQLLLFTSLVLIAINSYGQNETTQQKFSQLDQELPTPNNYRTASGAPGHEYWQCQADYKMKIDINDETQRLSGEETITFTNNSPDVLTYLWMQLDQNLFDKDSDSGKLRSTSIKDGKANTDELRRLAGESDYDGGFKLDYVNDMMGKKLAYTINKTMMRVELPTPLSKGSKFSFKVKWYYNINNNAKVGGRSGYEYFEEDKNYLYFIAQYFPRMCNYLDYQGWQHKQFLGAGEFTLPFGNYEVSITVPSDHLIAATGTLQNPKEVMTATQLVRWEQAKNSFEQPVVVANQDEAIVREKTKEKNQKTWTFKAENVRDFAFASSRKFIWDAMAVKQSDGKIVLAQSMYPKEGNPLWGQYSTKAVAHTLKVYSSHTFDYPYPTAWSVNAKDMGMEYPMICFNFGRCEKDGSYSERMKYGMIGVIIHEVGHNYFPMIVNSDERQWTWMDEGLNTFLQYLAEQQWEKGYPSSRGPANKIVNYMKDDKSKLEPIMTNSESIQQFGNNAYGKTATALNILRETVMGRDLFDYSFKTYANRWKLKQPTPADFFRTMEDASAVDLDWFWRGWFYSTDNCDMALEDVKWYRLNTKNPEIDNAAKKKDQEDAAKNISVIRYQQQTTKTYEENDKTLEDFYSNYDPLAVSILDKDDYAKYLNNLSVNDKTELEAGKNYYEIGVKRIGGLVMPIIVKMEFTDGTDRVERIPAEIWRFNQTKITKVFVDKRELKRITLDPFLETADIDVSNNTYPAQPQISRFDLFKSEGGDRRNMGSGENPMQRAKRASEKKGN